MTDHDTLANPTTVGTVQAYPGNPGEFAARWNLWSDETRTDWLARAISDARMASRCFIQDDAGRIEHLEAEVERLRATLGDRRDELILALNPWMDHRNGAVTIRMTELLNIVSGSAVEAPQDVGNDSGSAS